MKQKGKSVQKLYFECYTPMALQEMEKIARHIQRDMGIKE